MPEGAESCGHDPVKGFDPESYDVGDEIDCPDCGQTFVVQFNGYQNRRIFVADYVADASTDGARGLCEKMSSDAVMDGTDRVMLDIETLGLDSGAAIVSIGACRFRPKDGVVGETFYVEIDMDSCCDAGLHIDDDTVEWWQEQDSELAPLDGDVALSDALARLKHYIRDADEVWANSPSFDCEMLETAYDAVGLNEPWEYDQERDVRTLRSLPNAAEVEMDGREHHALDDAIHQAREVAATIAQYNGDQDA